jgi:hypothetical protein
VTEEDIFKEEKKYLSNWFNKYVVNDRRVKVDQTKEKLEAVLKKLRNPTSK